MSSHVYNDCAPQTQDGDGLITAAVGQYKLLNGRTGNQLSSLRQQQQRKIPDAQVYTYDVVCPEEDGPSPPLSSSSQNYTGTAKRKRGDVSPVSDANYAIHDDILVKVPKYSIQDDILVKTALKPKVVKYATDDDILMMKAPTYALQDDILVKGGSVDPFRGYVPEPTAINYIQHELDDFTISEDQYHQVPSPAEGTVDITGYFEGSDVLRAKHSISDTYDGECKKQGRSGKKKTVPLKVDRGLYVCGRCGLPKKGHVCARLNAPRDIQSVGCQADLDPSMTIEEMKKDPEWRTRDILAVESKRTRRPMRYDV
jgi:hypothetical protein